MRKLFRKLFRGKPATPKTPRIEGRKRSFNFRRIITITRRTLGSLSLLTGLIGVTVVFLNPIPLLLSLFPIHYEAILQSDLAISASISFTLLVLGIGLLRTGLYDTLKAFVRGLKASPRAVLYSPVTFYKRIVVWRNWLLAKIEYLQSESAKWKTTFNVLKSPYSFLRMLGLSPQMAVSFLIAGSAVGGGVVVNETLLSERSFSRGDSGVYLAPLDSPTEYHEGSNTLRIDLGSTPVREITIENVSVGTVFTGSALPSGEANVVQISGNTISGGSSTRLEIGHLIFEKSRCKKLTLTDIQAHTLIVEGNASDGQSLAPSAGTSRMLAIGGGHHQADAMKTSGGTYDRILVQAPNSGINGKVGTMTLSNLYTKGGDCVLSKLNVGTLEIRLNEIGMGNGFGTKEFVISTDVTAANITITDNVEVTIAEPVTQ